MSKIKSQFIFTQKDRISTCTHEAAHAVLHSLGGTEVKFVVVANVNNKANSPLLSEGIGGICFIDETHKIANKFIRIDKKHNLYVDSAGFGEFMNTKTEKGKENVLLETRAFICAGLAGFAVESLIACKWVKTGGSGSDFYKCAVLCDLLPGGREELNYLVNEAAKKVSTLQHKIQALAVHLERFGEIDFTSKEVSLEYLPAPLTNWPQAFVN